MRTFRSRVRAIALFWLLGQAAALSAFVPAPCCTSHLEEQAAKDKEDCHESEPAREPKPGDACPMSHDRGDACPMHRGNGATDGCAMSNACDGPGAQLLSMFAYLGPIERPMTTEVTLDAAAIIVSPGAPPLFRFSSPDAPPPKA